MDAPVYARPAISLIATELGPVERISISAAATARATWNCSSVTGSPSSSTVRSTSISISCVRRVAVNDDLCASGYADIRYYKLGMIDGDGSPDTMMLGAYYILDGALRQTMPKRPTYPFVDGGNILVNCRGGRSRSVSLVALFLHKQQPHLFPTLDAAVAHIREHRELRPDEWFETPKPMLYEAARRASTWIDLVEASRAEANANG